MSNSWDGLRRLADASQEEEPLYSRAGTDHPLARSIDGTLLLVEVETPERGRDLLLVTRGDDSATGFSDYLRADWNDADVERQEGGAPMVPALAFLGLAALG